MASGAGLVAAMLVGCATQEGVPLMPPSWQSVRPGMQREQVHHLLGTPSQSQGTAEEIYLYAIERRHLELHVQYDAGGTVCEKRYHYLR